MKQDRAIDAQQPGKADAILVVDDSKMQRRILSSMLGRMGHHVIEAETAGEALEICGTGAVSIVVSDWMMPGMNGLEFCRALRGGDPQAYIYFILLTSKSGKGEIAQGLDAGADDFLTKPVNKEELRARIVAGQRILAMQKDLQSALDETQNLYEALDKDLIEARKLQTSLIREPEVPDPRADIRCFLQSSGRVGGDLVGSYPIGTDQVGIYSIDVSGHGVASALLSARLAGHLSATAPDQNVALRRNGVGYAAIPPDEAVNCLNDLILGDMDTEHYFTICLAHADLRTGRVEFCQAGHPHPAVQRADGDVEFFGEGGLPVGLIEDAEYESCQLTLGSGDRLLLYSDGLTECADADGALLDEGGLESLLRSARGARGRGVFDALLSGLQAFSGQTEFSDDLSAVLLERN